MPSGAIADVVSQLGGLDNANLHLYHINLHIQFKYLTLDCLDNIHNQRCIARNIRTQCSRMARSVNSRSIGIHSRVISAPACAIIRS